uniref:Uncharacterized protein n=1 Tax=Steinernema glaseri TaxID=37863 RepID=A0A1I7ZGI8_9BILA
MICGTVPEEDQIVQGLRFSRRTKFALKLLIFAKCSLCPEEKKIMGFFALVKEVLATIVQYILSCVYGSRFNL